MPQHPGRRVGAIDCAIAPSPYGNQGPMTSACPRSIAESTFVATSLGPDHERAPERGREDLRMREPGRRHEPRQDRCTSMPEPRNEALSERENAT